MILVERLKYALRELLDADREWFCGDHECVHCGENQQQGLAPHEGHAKDCPVTLAREALAEAEYA